MLLSLRDVLEATGGEATTSRKNIYFRGISTDSRKIKKGDLFIPLRGPNFDGRDFILDALKKGAAGAVSSKPSAITPKNKIIILLPKACQNSNKLYPELKALHSIARSYRDKFPAKLVAVTGSSGKTTTKDMIHRVLSAHGACLKTEENLNNEIGVPLTLLRLSNKHRYAVVEIGMQGPEEIRPLSVLCSPDIAAITNIGEAHIGKLKTKNNIAKAKSELLDGLKPKGTAILNADDKYFGFLNRAAKCGKVSSFGIQNPASLRAFDIRPAAKGSVFKLMINGRPQRFFVPLPGEHNIYNALVAIATGIALNIPLKSIKKGLIAFKPSSKRMDITTTKSGIKLINDTYNANPSSMSAAVKTLAGEKGRKIAVLGDMLELGKDSRKYHLDIGRQLRTTGIDIVIAVGKQARYYISGSATTADRFFADKQKAARHLLKLLKPGDAVLIKASRGLKLEEITQKILDNTD
jgi:UDP-N-acetylmuramoyl-tripeptide--D-alanyl-D-alanine ligase